MKVENQETTETYSINHMNRKSSTSEQGDFVEGALQLSHENVYEAIFGQMPCLFGVLVINHHFLLPAQLNLQIGKTKTRKRGFFAVLLWKVPIRKHLEIWLE